MIFSSLLPVAFEMTSPSSHSRDPLHGVTLESIVKQLVERFGWEEMSYRIPVRCFQFNPSVKSSLTFLRKTPWARKKVEMWFVEALADRSGWEEQGNPSRTADSKPESRDSTPTPAPRLVVRRNRNAEG